MRHFRSGSHTQTCAPCWFHVGQRLQFDLLSISASEFAVSTPQPFAESHASRFHLMFPASREPLGSCSGPGSRSVSLPSPLSSGTDVASMPTIDISHLDAVPSSSIGAVGQGPPSMPATSMNVRSQGSSRAWVPLSQSCGNQGSRFLTTGSCAQSTEFQPLDTGAYCRNDDFPHLLSNAGPHTVDHWSKRTPCLEGIGWNTGSKFKPHVRLDYERRERAPSFAQLVPAPPGADSAPKYYMGYINPLTEYR